jgi:hypothetical protein
MELKSFRSWLEAYGAAWVARDPEASAALFEEDGTYQVTPFLEPIRGRRAILEYWTQVARTQEDISFGCEVLAVTSEMGIARWWASFVRVPPGLDTKLDGIFVITLGTQGRCRTLREWWHKDQR